VSQSADVNPRVAAAVLVIALALLLFGGWWIWFRQPPQVMPPGVTDPSRLTEDYYSGRYRPGVGYVNTPSSTPAPATPGAAPR
jgi:hypothetical protein